jgi:uncharacterized protein
VYLHKTVLSAEQMLVRIIRRARLIKAQCQEPLNSFINLPVTAVTLEQFCSIDDYDVLMAIKHWAANDDKVLSVLCRGILDRQLLKVKYFPEQVSNELLDEKIEEVCKKCNISREDAKWLAFRGEAASSIYNFENEHIHILFKDGSVKDISEVDNALINENLRGTVKKYYICYLR